MFIRVCQIRVEEAYPFFHNGPSWFQLQYTHDIFTIHQWFQLPYFLQPCISRSQMIEQLIEKLTCQQEVRNFKVCTHFQNCVLNPIK